MLFSFETNANAVEVYSQGHKHKHKQSEKSQNFKAQCGLDKYIKKYEKKKKVKVRAQTNPNLKNYLLDKEMSMSQQITENPNLPLCTMSKP